MFALRSTFIISCFLILSIISVIASFNVDLKVSVSKNKKNQKKASDFEQTSFFEEVEYFLKNNGKPSLRMFADKSRTHQGKKLTYFFEPVGESYTADGEPVHFKSHQGHLNQVKNYVVLKDDVVIYTDESELKSNQAYYAINSGFFKAEGEVKTKNYSKKTRDKIYIDSDFADSWPTKKIGHYKGNVKGKIIRFLRYEPPVHFSSDELHSDINKSYIELIGNVKLRKQQVRARSLRGEIFLENYNKKLKYYVLYDDVVVKEKVKLRDKTVFTRKAFGEKLEGITSEDKIILTGYPKVIQQEEVILGNTIILLEGNDVVEVDDANSRVKIKE